MEGVPCEREGGKLRLGHLRSGLVVVPIAFGFDPQAGLGGGGTDELDDGPVGHERSSPPVHGDEAEHAVFDLG